MIIYLYGPDSYRRNKNLQELIRAYRDKYRDTDLLAVDLGDTPDDWIKIRDFLNQPSMFVESKVAVVKENSAVKSKEWIEVLKSHLKSSKTFVLISDAVEPEDNFKFLLKEPVESRYFEELKGERLVSFLRKEAVIRRLVFSAEAWNYFYKFIDNNPDKSWRAVNELEKISLANLPQPISLKDTQSLINWLPKEEVYLAAREMAIGRGYKVRLSALERALLQKEDPSRIFNSLVYQVRGSQIEKLADYDVSIKSGGLEPEQALLDFVLS